MLRTNESCRSPVNKTVFSSVLKRIPFRYKSPACVTPLLLVCLISGGQQIIGYSRLYRFPGIGIPYPSGIDITENIYPFYGVTKECDAHLFTRHTVAPPAALLYAGASTVGVS
jgi:hypothetical protein